ncbi:unnamed protein product [Paramecium pentaurelia]|uniref:Uncharacterized protein n=1 Tax=Paramecium pentaurelia TaxID=43138 RepID=A0A8S1VMN5_9CILI|nr:unnamed protein product [Paramecium pentaurelia]
MQNKQLVTRTTTRRNLLQSQSVLESSIKSSILQKSNFHLQLQSQVISNNNNNQNHEDKYISQNPYFNDLSCISHDSENDIFRDCPTYKNGPKSTGSLKSRSKILNQMAYITQKMIPEFQRGIQLISQAEDKVLDFRVEQSEQPVRISSQQLGLGEIMINYQQDKHPIELRPDLWNVQSVRQMEFYYYKLRSKQQPVPLQFYMNQSETTNFKIFVSSVNPFPTKFSCDQIISVKGWKYKIDESKSFHCEYIYISMVCDLDTQVKLKFQFGSRLMKRPQTIQRKIEPSSLFIRSVHHQQLERMNSDLLNAQVEEIKKRRKEKLRQRGMFKDLIKENIQKVVEYNEEHQKSFRELKKTQGDNRIEDVLCRKKLMSQNEQQRKEYQQKTKELSKIIRQRHNFVQSKKYLKNRVCTHWFNNIYMSLICTKIYFMFQHKIEAQNQSTLMAFQVKRIMKRIHKRLSAIKGVTIYDRVFFDVKLVLQGFCKAVYQKQVKLHIEKIVPHLKIRAEIYHLKSQVLITNLKISKIRVMFLEFLLRYKSYKQMLHNLWNKYFKEQFLKYYNGLDQSKKGIYQPYIIQLQNQDNFIQLQSIFIETYSKDKLRKYLKDMSIYAKYLKKLRSQKYNKTKRRDFTNDQVLHSPRMFQLPTYDEVLEYLPLLVVNTNKLDSRTSQQIQQSQMPLIQESQEKKKKQAKSKK